MRIQAVAAAIAPVFILSLAIVSFRSCGDRPPSNESARVAAWKDTRAAGGALMGTSQYESPQKAKALSGELSPQRHQPESSPATRADDLLWRAICQVESGGNPNAYNEREGAAGIVQIREICVRDCNRILGIERFSLGNRWNPVMSHEMFKIYTQHYAERGTHEEAARIWNGGGSGMRKTATIKYWLKVKAEIERMR